MPSARITDAHRLLTDAVQALDHAAGPGAEESDLLAALSIAHGCARGLDRVTVDAIAALQRRGAFTQRGYRHPATAIADLLGCERFEARRLVAAAEQVTPRSGLDGTALPPRLPDTAAAFHADAVGVRHVEMIARVLDTPAAARLSPAVWAGAEQQLAAHAALCTPTELHTWATALVEALDQDGAEPDHDQRPPVPVNELRVRRHRDRPGGSLTGRFDDPAMFAAIATVVDTGTRPARNADSADSAGGEGAVGDERTPAQRAAAALADACGFVLDHGDLPQTAGTRPHLSVLVGLEDLERRARAAVLDLAGPLTPAALRRLACDAAVIPIVLGGDGQPLDVGRATRTVPDGLRRAVIARDRGCARCGRPPSWCEAHHIVAWQHGGVTAIENLVLLCRACHRLIHHAGWTVELTGGRAEFTPPTWIDPDRRPRPGPPRVIDLDHLLATAGAPSGRPPPRH